MRFLQPLLPLVGMQVSLGEIARPAEELDVRDVVRPAKHNRKDVVLVVAGRQIGTAKAIGAKHSLRDLHRLDLSEGVAAGGAALSIPATALMDSEKGTILLRPSFVAGRDHGLVGVAEYLALLSDRFLVLLLIGSNRRESLVAVLGVVRSLDLFRALGVLLAEALHVLTVALQTLLAFRRALGDVAVYARDASVVVRQAFLSCFFPSHNLGVAGLVVIDQCRSLLSTRNEFGVSVPHGRNVCVRAGEALARVYIALGQMSVSAWNGRVVAQKAKSLRLIARNYLHALYAIITRVNTASTFSNAWRLPAPALSYGSN